MHLLSRLNIKYHCYTGKKPGIRRAQYNMTIAEDVIAGVKALAATLKLPQYVVAEHLLQVGAYFVVRALQDEDAGPALEEHLVKAHLLGDELADSEDILTLGTDGLACE